MSSGAGAGAAEDASPPAATPAAAAPPAATPAAAAPPAASESHEPLGEEALQAHLPVLLVSPVVKGFGRGSKTLGIPTANMDIELPTVGPLIEGLPTGIFLGWAYLPGRGVFKAVASIGYNPYFQNKVKTVEPHLIHDFQEDFYGEELRFLVCGYVRPERSFPSLEALVEAIHNDISVASQALDGAPHKAYGAEQLGWTTAADPAAWKSNGR